MSNKGLHKIDLENMEFGGHPKHLEPVTQAELAEMRVRLKETEAKWKARLEALQADMKVLENLLLKAWDDLAIKKEEHNGRADKTL